MNRDCSLSITQQPTLQKWVFQKIQLEHTYGFNGTEVLQQPVNSLSDNNKA